MADRNVEINLIGRNRLSASTRAAANDLEKLARKVDRLEKKLAGVQREKIKIRTDVDTSQLGRLRRRFRALGGEFGAFGRRAGNAFSIALGNAIADGTRAIGNGVRTALLKGGPALQAAAAILAARIAGFIGQALTAGFALFAGPALLAGPIAFLLKQQLKASEQIKKSENRIATLKKNLELAKTKATKDRIEKQIAQERRIIAEQERQARQWERLKSRARAFMDFISRPLKIPLADSLDAIGDGLERLRKPVRDIMAQLGPALAPFTKGVMNGLLVFIKALEPAMPGIVAGMRAWGKEMPKIGKALGDMIAKIMSDPDAVVTAVSQISSAIQGLASFSGSVVKGLTDLGNAFHTLDVAVEAFDTGKLENLPEVSLGLAGSLHGMTQALLEEKVAWLRHLDDITTAFARSPLGGGLIWKAASKKIHEARVAAEGELTAFNKTILDTAFETAKKPMIIRVETRLAKAKADLDQLKAKLRDPNLSKKRRIEIQAKINAAEANIKRLRAKLAALRAEKTVPKIQANITQAEAKVAALRKKLKETHNSKTRAKIRGEIKDALAKIAQLKAQLKSIKDEDVNIWIKVNRSVKTYYGGDPVPTNPKGRAASSWGSALDGGGMHRTEPPRVSVAAPVVNTRVSIDGRDLAASVRTQIIDENKRNIYRARVGRRL